MVDTPLAMHINEYNREGKCSSLSYEYEKQQVTKVKEDKLTFSNQPIPRPRNGINLLMHAQEGTVDVLLL